MVFGVDLTKQKQHHIFHLTINSLKTIDIITISCNKIKFLLSCYPSGPLGLQERSFISPPSEHPLPLSNAGHAELLLTHHGYFPHYFNLGVINLVFIE
jgi:hypothetical protein